MVKKPTNEDRARAVIQAKLAALAAPLARLPWKFQVAAAGVLTEDAAAPNFDDSGWEDPQLPFTWSSLDGEGWFRAEVVLPDAVEGIPLAGSRLELDIFLTIGASIYVDGIPCFTEPSWSDTRAVPLLLVEQLEPGKPITLAVRCNAGDGFALFASARLRAAVLDEVAFDLDLAQSQIAFTHFLAEQRNEKIQELWQRATRAVDLEALAANDWSRWQSSLATMRDTLAPFGAIAKSYTVHLVAHSHIDMNWLWPMQETIDVCRRDFGAMVKLMDAYPEFNFSQSQAATYAMTQRDFPELFKEMRKRVRSGQWEVTANTWVEGDLNMAAGESLVRQLLHGRHYVARELEVKPQVCWEPDTFGHTAAFPQLLAQAGVKYYYFCRAGRRHPLFWWEGPDGSRVLACQDPRGYNGEVTPGNVAGSLLDFARRSGLRRGLYVYGVGDHGGSGTARDIEAARRIDADPLMPAARPSPAVAFFEGALKDLDRSPGQDSLPVVRGELNTVFEGCYTSHGDIKRLNRDAENGLLTAETLATLATLLTATKYPGEALAEAWRTASFHQFHDILCGCAIGVTYREAHERMAVVLDTAQTVTATAAHALAKAMHTGEGPGPRVVVFNQLGWTRSDIVRVPLAALPPVAYASVVDDAGVRTAAQTSDGCLFFTAHDIPALGARVYAPSETPVHDNPAAVHSPAPIALENGLLRLHVHPRSGALDQLVDKAEGRDLAGPWAGWGPEAKVNAGMLNRLQILWEQPHPMSAWNIGDITRTENLIEGAEVRLVESGPVRGVVEVRRRFLNSSLQQRIVLYAGLPRIDFETEVDWHERGGAHHDAPMLRATFSPHLGPTHASFEAAFGAVRRPADGREVPALRWADLSEGRRYGLSLLNDSKYGHQAHGNTLGLTLLRASYEPDVNPDEGLHQFTYALYPHAADWDAGGTLQQAAQLNQPLVAVVTDGHSGRKRFAGKWIELAMRPIEAAPGQAVLSALKLAEDQPKDGVAVILRLYEATGHPARAVVRLPWKLSNAHAIGPAEETRRARPADDRLLVRRRSLRALLAPHEIVTLRLTLSR